MIRAGKFEMEIGGPYPVWCEIYYDGESTGVRFQHDELNDLEYLVKKTMKVARQKLKKDQGEV